MKPVFFKRTFKVYGRTDKYDTYISFFDTKKQAEKEIQTYLEGRVPVASDYPEFIICEEVSHIVKSIKREVKS